MKYVFCLEKCCFVVLVFSLYLKKLLLHCSCIVGLFFRSNILTGSVFLKVQTLGPQRTGAVVQV